MFDEFMQAAIQEAQLGEREGGIPIGSVLVYRGRILGRGHNRRTVNGHGTPLVGSTGRFRLTVTRIPEEKKRHAGSTLCPNPIRWCSCECLDGMFVSDKSRALIHTGH